MNFGHPLNSDERISFWPDHGRVDQSLARSIGTLNCLLLKYKPQN